MATAEKLKTYSVFFPRVAASTADALYDSAWRLTMSHKFNEVLGGLYESALEPYALEIFYSNQTFSLCFTASGATANAIHGSLMQIFPFADVREIPDPLENISEESVISVANITYGKWDIYPSLNYRDTMCDPIAPIVNAISQVGTDHFTVLQVSLKQLHGNWQLFGWLTLLRVVDRLIHFARVKYWFKRGVRGKQLEGIMKKAPAQYWRTCIRVALIAEGSEAVKNKAAHIERMKRETANILTGISIQNAKDENFYKIHSTNYGYKALLPLIHRQTGGWSRPAMRMANNEIPGFWHLPNVGNLTNAMMVLAQRLPPPGDLPIDKTDPNISILGRTIFRGQHIDFGMRREDRQRHVLITGAAGMGKHQLMQHLIRSDFENGYGAGILDPDGRLFDQALKLVPKDRIDDVVIFDPEDIEFPAGLNPFELVDESSRMRVATGLLEMFRLRFSRQWSDRIEHLLYFTIYALLSTQWTTVLSMRRMLTDPVYRGAVTSNTQDRVVRKFWEKEFPLWATEFSDSVITPLLRMVEDFVGSEMLRNCLGQPYNRFDFRSIIDSRKLLFMKISSRALGNDAAALLGAMVLTRIYQAAMSRADTPFEQRPDFYLYVNDFDAFATASFEEILSESRKYHLNLTCCCDNLNLLPPNVRSTIFGNVGSLFAFRSVADDAERVANELQPIVTASDLVNLPPKEFYVKMTVRAKAQEVFSGEVHPVEYPEKSLEKQCLDHSRATYCLPREQARSIIQTWGQVG